MNRYNCIVRNPKIRGGRPTIKGTRLEVHWLVLRLTSNGFDDLSMSQKEVMEEYDLTLEQIDQAMLYFWKEMPIEEVLEFITEENED